MNNDTNDDLNLRIVGYTKSVTVGVECRVGSHINYIVLFNK